MVQGHMSQISQSIKIDTTQAEQDLKTTLTDLSTDLLNKYIDENKSPVLDMMIQFKTQEADCLFTDYYHMKFSLRKLKRAYKHSVCM